MKLLQNERVILESHPFKAFYLTNFRVRWERVKGNRLEVVSIMLEELTSVELMFRHSLNILTFGIMIGVVCTAAGITVGSYVEVPSIGQLGLAGGAICVLLGTVMYFLSRKYYMVFSSPSAQIVINVNGLGDSEIEDIMAMVEDAKNERFLSSSQEKPASMSSMIRRKPQGSN